MYVGLLTRPANIHDWKQRVRNKISPIPQKISVVKGTTPSLMPNFKNGVKVYLHDLSHQIKTYISNDISNVPIYRVGHAIIWSQKSGRIIQTSDGGVKWVYIFLYDFNTKLGKKNYKRKKIGSYIY